MITLKPNELSFPFHVFSNPKQMEDVDLSFSYHVFWGEEGKRGICNDIPCPMCPFQAKCEDGKNRQDVLISYSEIHFPEMLI